MTPSLRPDKIECSLKFLEEVRDLAVKHRANIEYIKSLEEDAKGVGGVDYSRDLVTTSPSPDALPNSVLNLIEMKRKAEADSAEYFERKADARERLDEMGGTYGRLLLLRYATALPWISVAEAMGYSEGTCRNMNDEAILAFYDFLPLAYRLPEPDAILDADFKA